MDDGGEQARPLAAAPPTVKHSIVYLLKNDHGELVISPPPNPALCVA